MTLKTILCYGDSNTWGYVPNPGEENFTKSRYSRDERWTGLLQKLLGIDYYVIEEGLNSRTTNLDYPVPPDRNGRTYLPPCLYSHSPIDLVILALGGNDLKSCFNRTPKEIQEGLADLIDIMKKSEYGPGLCQPPEILITTVPIPLPIAETYRDENNELVFEGGINKAKILVEIFFQLANQRKCHFLDISEKIIPSNIDGVHLDVIGHNKLAVMLHRKINSIL